MVSDGSSYYSEDSERSLTSDEENYSEGSWEDEEDEEYIYNSREVFGLKLIADEKSGIKPLDNGEFQVDGSDGVTRWIRVMIDSSIQTEHRKVVEEVLNKVFKGSEFSSGNFNLEYPAKVKVTNKKTGIEEYLILDFQLPRGDEILLAKIPSESKPVVNSLMSHLYIYKHNEGGLQFKNYHKDQKVDDCFGFKTWHKYHHK
ncbi:uncharacterized protein cubi_01499 [Cryptosporidium ubiquitum]|uniref:Uncharacterized protein n=1 Tax=Cryptosporidium ubiquitum TaxID=857276 RepID=A0A1J4MD70_9CRYT|nr:uncharacterized protein cubi_01499 [Cryptosporidium ubiquitum]OII72166.1 hypothetical protein cubi_01499 [Cryptosporidium ubiquitum]